MKKGDVVYMFNSWDDKGMFSSSRIVVQSCGAKRMTALREEGGQMIKCFIYANEYDRLVPAADLADAEAVRAEGTRRAAAYLAQQLEFNRKYRLGHEAYVQSVIIERITLLENAVPDCLPWKELCTRIRAAA